MGTDHLKGLLTDVLDGGSIVCFVNGPLLLSDGEDALGGIIVCNGDTLLEQWMLVILIGRRYFYHISWGFICQMRGLFVRLGSMDSVGTLDDVDIFRLLQQMAMMSLQQPTQQHTRFYYHYCNSLAGSEMVLGLLLLEVLQ
jgi:hypothetical protein